MLALKWGKMQGLKAQFLKNLTNFSLSAMFLEHCVMREVLQKTVKRVKCISIGIHWNGKTFCVNILKTNRNVRLVAIDA